MPFIFYMGQYLIRDMEMTWHSRYTPHDCLDTKIHLCPAWATSLMCLGGVSSRIPYNLLSSHAKIIVRHSYTNTDVRHTIQSPKSHSGPGPQPLSGCSKCLVLISTIVSWVWLIRYRSHSRTYRHSSSFCSTINHPMLSSERSTYEIKFT